MTNPKPNTAKPSGKWQGQGSRHERGYGYEWTKVRALVLRIDGYLCQPCERAGRPTPATEVDHIIPKSLGGDDSADNLEAICTDCHKDKTSREATESRGGTAKPRIRFDASGAVIWPE